MNYDKNKLKFPSIGMRIMKSSIAVFICYLIYLLRNKNGIVFYSQLAVLWCIQPYFDTSLKKALQRTTGTFIGAFYGLIVLVITYYFFDTGLFFDLAEYLLISLMIIPIIYTTLILNKTDASYFSCVVFLSIVVIHSHDLNPWLFVFNRVVDTMIGILVGISVNAFHLPHKKHKEILFVSGIDDTLLFYNDHLSAYSKVELNRMIRDGANFTLSTLRTPASLMESMSTISLKLPVIAMDGAVLYDISQKKYLKAYTLSYPTTCKLVDLIRAEGIHAFINVVVQDMLIIYHKDFNHDVERQIYSHLHTSPYRNYLYQELPEGLSCVYIMCIDETEKMTVLYNKIKNSSYFQQLKVLFYPSTDYPGYSYIKIYNKNASKEHMMEYLKESLNCNKTVTFGTIEGKYDYIIGPNEQNSVVKKMKKLYETPIWAKKES